MAEQEVGLAPLAKWEAENRVLARAAEEAKCRKYAFSGLAKHSNTSKARAGRAQCHPASTSAFAQAPASA